MSFVKYFAKMGFSAALILFNTSAILLLFGHVTSTKHLTLSSTSMFCGAVILFAFSTLAVIL